MCQSPPPQLQKFLLQFDKTATTQAVAAKNRLTELNKAAAREQLLRIQLEIARKFPK